MKEQLTILLADDDQDDRDFFDKAVKELSISAQLTTVHDGEHLMTYLSENSETLPTVLFLDLNMPRKDGFECLAEIKQNEKLKDLPVVIFSTSFSHDKITMLFNKGAHIYVRKPNNFEQLVEVIHNALPIAVESFFKNSPANNQLKYILNA